MGALYGARDSLARAHRDGTSAAGPSVLDLTPIQVDVSEGRISLASTGAESITEGLPTLWWRASGGASWTESRAMRWGRVGRQGASLTLPAQLGPIAAQIRLSPFIENRVWRLAGTLTNTGASAVELARFNYLRARLAGTGFLELNGGREQPSWRQGQSNVAPRPDLESFWRGMGVVWPRFSDPLSDAEGWYASTDYAAFTNGWNQPGWGVGFVGPGNAFGEVGFKGEGTAAEIYAGVLLDGVTLDAGQTLVLEEALIWNGDLQSGLAMWAGACAKELRARKPAAPIVGYCSWYQLGGAVREADMERAIREFEHEPRPPGGRLVQLDAGWEASDGDWTPNEKFKNWRTLPGRIQATGSIPGLWIAPLMVSEGNPLALQHPEWLQRMADGQPAIRFPGAATGASAPKTFFLDPDLAPVKAFIAEAFHRLTAEGWRYFKIDFTYPVTGARFAPRRVKTSFQSQRELYALIRQTVGEDVVLNACIGAAGRYAIGSADVARVGGDASFSFTNVKDSLKQSLSRFTTNGIWFQADADVFTLRSVASKLNMEERRLQTGTLGLSGGIFLTSDFPSQWAPQDAEFVRQFWNDRGPIRPERQYVAWSKEGEIVAYRASFNAAAGWIHRVGLYNWDDKPRNTAVSLDAVRLSPKVCLMGGATREGYRLHDGVISVSEQPAHSMRIVDLSECS